MTLFKPQLPAADNKLSKVDLQATYDAIIAQLLTLSKAAINMPGLSAGVTLTKINQIFVDIGLKRPEELVAKSSGVMSMFKNRMTDAISEAKGSDSPDQGPAQEEQKRNTFGS